MSARYQHGKEHGSPAHHEHRLLVPIFFAFSSFSTNGLVSRYLNMNTGLTDCSQHCREDWPRMTLGLNHMATAYTSAGFGSLSLIVRSLVGRCLYTFTHAVPACGSRALKPKPTTPRESRSYLLDFQKDSQQLVSHVSVKRRFGFAAAMCIGHTCTSISAHSAPHIVTAHVITNSDTKVHGVFL